MIIECEKCSKKFEVQDNLIPVKGRLLQCGSCAFKWHYIPKTKTSLSEKTETIEKKESNKTKKVKQKYIPKQKNKSSDLENEDISAPKEAKKGIGFINYIFLIIINFIAFIILADTFKNQLSSVIPNIDLYINSLHELLKDIYLFISDLFK